MTNFFHSRHYRHFSKFFSKFMAKMAKALPSPKRDSLDWVTVFQLIVVTTHFRTGKSLCHWTALKRLHVVMIPWAWKGWCWYNNVIHTWYIDVQIGSLQNSASQIVVSIKCGVYLNILYSLKTHHIIRLPSERSLYYLANHVKVCVARGGF
jgi:hypothetical protein